MSRAILILFITVLLGCTRIFDPEPQLMTIDYDHLLEIRESIFEKSPLYQAAYQRLCREAEEALKHPIYSVVDKNNLPPSGDRQDYMSQAPYWWPDPEEPDGLPYIRKDGIRNPEVSADNFDKNRLVSMGEDVNALTLAWFFSGNREYADRASGLVRGWFLDTETAMNPNLNFAQSIPGITDGRGIGIIDTRIFIEIIESVKILEESKSWSRADSKQLQGWFTEYLYWLENSENGKDEKGKENNHGTWYDVQTAYYAMYTGNTERAREIVRSAGEVRIDTQIDSLGRQDYELSRTRAYGYSVFNLEALVYLGKIGELTGVDLWKYKSPCDANIKLALDYILNYVDSLEEWPHQQITQVEWTRLIPVVMEAERVYEDPEYQDCLMQLQQKMTNTDRLILTKI